MDGSSLWHGYVNLTDNSFSGWMWLSGATDSAPTLTDYADKLALVVTGLDDRLYYRLYDCVGDTWDAWTPWSSGATYDGPAASMLGDELHVVVRGIDGYSLWHSYKNLTSSAFSGWQLIMGASKSKPALTCSTSSPELYLIVRGADNCTYYTLWDGVGWERWTAVLTGITCDGPGATVINNKLQIVVRGMDESSLWHGNVDLTTGDFAGWSWLSGATESAPAVTS